MAKTFFEVFPTLQLNEQLRAIFEDIEIEKVATDTDRTYLRVHILGQELIPKKQIVQVESAIKEQLFLHANLQVKLEERYQLAALFTPQDLMREYYESILWELKERSIVEHNLFLNAEHYFEGDVLHLVFEKSVISEQKSKAIVERLHEIIAERCGLALDVVTEYREVQDRNREARNEQRLQQQVNAIVDENTAKSRELREEKAVEKAERKAVKETKTKQFYRAPKKPDDPNLIYGRDVDGEEIELSGVIGEMGEIVFRGKVISTETREIRNEKSIFTFSVTDFTDSITIKMFLRNAQLPEMLAEIKTGAFLRIKGVTKLDTYDNELTIASVFGIKKISDFTVSRKDTSPEKRVELHCHTKMSDMDGISDSIRIAKRAHDWGHKALAITDHGVVQAFTEVNHYIQDLAKADKDDPFKIIYGVEAYLADDLLDAAAEGKEQVIKKLPTYHAIILAQNDVGRVNLYRLISMSHLTYYARRPRIPKSEFLKYREGLLIGSACEAGELFQALLTNQSEEAIARLVEFYDYLEIQPLGNNRFMIDSEKLPDIQSVEDLKEFNRKIVRLGEQFHKPVVATCDVHFLDPEDEVYRRIIMAGKHFADADNQAPLYLRTTEEMLDEFAYLGSKKAYEVVVTNTNKIADTIEKISPVRPDKCPPVIPDSDKTLREICYQKAHSMYGEELPAIVVERLERELHSIISNGFAVMYIIAQKLVWKSNEDGYLVGSRGSVGSSFVATMAGITEVNPLSPHYYCPHCHYSDFESEEVRKYAGGCGWDMPDKVCPNCGEPLMKDGFDIPFETFLGFKGDKEPDIDLNFSGDYQSQAHKYTEVIFGKGQTYRAGTIGTLADKTAYGYVKNYYEERGIGKRRCEIERLAEGCTGVRRSTGQHPGGIIVLPIGEEINSFTPVQHPANDMTTDIITTHFDYHSIDHNLLKLDILGHDDPTMIKMLEELVAQLTGEPFTATKIPLDEPGVMRLFADTSPLGITPEDIDGCPLGCLGIPEFGTDFVIQMVVDTKPKTLSDLIRISGLSHGTDVWLNNAQTLIQDGKATISTAICTRDDIMTFLINSGMESERSFKIMEAVRKGTVAKGKCANWEEWKADMLAHGIPEWYVWSCEQIKYMFPKAHAAAYVMMAYRIAYCKVYYPLAYYAAYFSIRANAFSYELMCQGREKLELLIRDYKRRNDSLSNKEQDSLKDMRLVQEMYARGFDFLPIDLYRSKAAKLQIVDGKLLPPFSSIEGMGEKAAEAVELAAKEGPFLSKDDFRQRTKVSTTVIEKMSELGLFGDLPETNQLSLFDF